MPQHVSHLRELTKSDVKAFYLETRALIEMISIILFLAFHSYLNNFVVFLICVAMGIIVSTVSTIYVYSPNPISGSKLLGEGNLEKWWMAREACHVKKLAPGEEDESTPILTDSKFAVLFVTVA